MRLRPNRHLRHRSPEPEGEGGAVTPPPGPPAPPPALTRPDGLGDDYWDATKGVKFDALLPKVTQYDALMAQVPKDADSIQWGLGDDPLDPDEPDTLYELNKDDPLVATFAPIFVEHKIPQPAINAMTRAFASMELKRAKESTALLRAEEAKLGDAHKARTDAVQAFLATALAGQNADAATKTKAEARAAAFRNTIFTAEQVLVLEDLAKQFAGPNPPPPGPPPPASGLPADEKERARIWAERSKQQ